MSWIYSTYETRDGQEVKLPRRIAFVAVERVPRERLIDMVGEEARDIYSHRCRGTQNPDVPDEELQPLRIELFYKMLRNIAYKECLRWATGLSLSPKTESATEFSNIFKIMDNEYNEITKQLDETKKAKEKKKQDRTIKDEILIRMHRKNQRARDRLKQLGCGSAGILRGYEKNASLVFNKYIKAENIAHRLGKGSAPCEVKIWNAEKLEAHIRTMTKNGRKDDPRRGRQPPRHDHHNAHPHTKTPCKTPERKLSQPMTLGAIAEEATTPAEASPKPSDSVRRRLHTRISTEIDSSATWSFGIPIVIMTIIAYMIFMRGMRKTHA